MFIVLIGGGYSGCGKTTFGTGLLRLLGKGWGVIKYTKTAFSSTIVSRSDILKIHGKDTARYLEAGAEKVLWLQGHPEGLKEALFKGLKRLSSCRGVIIEGNTPIEFLTPDVVVFVEGEKGSAKSSAEKVRIKAHIIVKGPDMERAMRDARDLIEKRLSAKEELIKKAVNKRIPCRVARLIAESHGLNYRDIGEMADALGIKITDCELGCF